MSMSVSRIEQAARLENLGMNVRSRITSGQMVRPVERRELVERVVGLLAAGSSVLLRGEPGVGKTELARSLALAAWPVPKRALGQLQLIDMNAERSAPPLIETAAARFVEGCYYAHELENKMRLSLDAVAGRRGVLFVDNIEECLGLGASSNDPHTDVATLLMPHLDAGLRVVGTTTPEGEARMRSRNERFYRHFVVVDVCEPSAEESQAIARVHLDAVRAAGTRVSDDAVEAGMLLASRFLPGAIPVEALLRLARRAAAARGAVDPRSLHEAVAAELGIDERFVRGTPPSFAELEAQLTESVFGQPEATREVADALLRFATGLAPARRPIATLLFAGPSGCGKTTLALAAARAFTGSEDALVRCDMSEYADPYAAPRLIGDDEASLVSRLRARPSGVLLLDEIEKAHASVIRLLLPALGEARLTSQRGHTARLDNYLVIATSNVGITRWIRGHSRERIVTGVLSDAAQEFPPEFRGRLTRTVVFRPIGQDTTARIVERELEQLADLPGLTTRGLQLLWTDTLVEALCDHQASLQTGARSLQTVVRGLVASPLARWLAENPSAGTGIVTLAPRVVQGRIESLTVDWFDESACAPGPLH